jgi:hypothetical protein
MPGQYHDPYNGEDFNGLIFLGTRIVISPAGHNLQYTVTSGNQTSTCLCPVCSQSFVVDLIPDYPDAIIACKFEYENNCMYVVVI